MWRDETSGQWACYASFRTSPSCDPVTGYTYWCSVASSTCPIGDWSYNASCTDDYCKSSAFCATDPPSPSPPLQPFDYNQYHLLMDNSPRSTCEHDILTAAECGAAARILGLPDTSAEVIYQPANFPSFCSAGVSFESGELYFNTASNSEYTGIDDIRVRVCRGEAPPSPPPPPPSPSPPPYPPHSPGAAYHLKTSGLCADPITTQAECEQAARFLKLGDIIADILQSVSYDAYAPYCSQHNYRNTNGVHLYFNSGTSTSNCGIDDECLCRGSAPPSLPPPPSPRSPPRSPPPATQISDGGGSPVLGGGGDGGGSGGGESGSSGGGGGSSSPSSLTAPVEDRYVFKFTATVAGTIDSFDQATYKSQLARLLGNGISAADISLKVTPASVEVEATVAAPSEGAANAATSKLNGLGAEELSSSLGVTVEAKQPTTAPTSETSQSLERSSDDGGSAAIIYGAGVGGGCLLLLLLSLLFFWVRRKQRTSKERSPSVPSTSSPSAASTYPDTRAKDSIYVGVQDGTSDATVVVEVEHTPPDGTTPETITLGTGTLES